MVLAVTIDGGVRETDLGDVTVASRYLSEVVLAKARTHTAESLRGCRWQTTFAK